MAKNDSGANLGFEAQLWEMIAKLHGESAERAELEHAVEDDLEELGYGG